MINWEQLWNCLLPVIIPGERCRCCAEAIRPFASQTCALSSDFDFITVPKDEAARVLVVDLYVVLEAWL